MNRKFIIGLILTLLISLSGCAKNGDNTLTIGMELQYPPFETTNIDGEPEGISVDLAYALGKHLNRNVEIQNIAWDGLIPAIQSGKIDIINISRTIKINYLLNERKLICK